MSKQIFKVFKYPFEVADFIRIEMPINAQILSAQVQNGQPCIWALVDAFADKEERNFVMYGTGHRIDDPTELNFIGPIQMHEGMAVFPLI